MLIDKSQAVEINDIVTIKLLSGEEIVGKLVERTIDSVFLAKPIRVVLEPISATQVGLSLLPVLGSVIDTPSVQFPFAGMAIRPLKTGSETRSRYLEITTGLVTPTPEQRSIIT
jgi:hypothetical protein